MSDVTIWHNPRCSKSRQTLQLLEGRGLQPKVVNYLEDPPSEDALRDALGKLGVEPRGLMRTREAAYKELGLAGDSKGEADLVAAMHSNPILIERPVVFANGKARLGRPPESVLEIL